MEHDAVPFDKKVGWISGLIESGVDIVQVGSFVHPIKVPQMADTDRLFEYFLQPRVRPERTTLSCLVLNEKGLERGLACGVDMFCMGVSASESHSLKNTGMTIEDAARRIVHMAQTALRENKSVQVSVQSAFGCGYEGTVPFEQVLSIVERFREADLRTISLADTAGHASPDQVSRYFETLMSRIPDAAMACHFHNTYGLGLANCWAAMSAGVTSIESSFAGLGGCPFTRIAGGNVCTEDLVHMMHRMGLRQDIRLQPLIDVARQAAEYFNRELPGVVYRTGPIMENSEVL